MPAALATIKKSCDSYTKREGERQCDPNERLLAAQIFKFFSFISKPSWNNSVPTQGNYEDAQSTPPSPALAKS
jgi:hypothetical protein